MTAKPYFPPPDPAWETIKSEAAGFNPVLLRKAVDFAIANETEWTRDLERPLSEKVAEPPPYNEIIGPGIKRHLNISSKPDICRHVGSRYCGCSGSWRN